MESEGKRGVKADSRCLAWGTGTLESHWLRQRSLLQGPEGDEGGVRSQEFASRGMQNARCLSDIQGPVQSSTGERRKQARE